MATPRRSESLADLRQLDMEIGTCETPNYNSNKKRLAATAISALISFLV